MLHLAARDKEFRTSFLAQRADAAASQGIELSLSERKILEVVPREQLEAMIDHVVVPKPARRGFLRQTAASAAVLLGGAGLLEVLTGCDGRPGRNRTQTVGGIAPDIPEPDPDPDPDPDPESDPEPEPDPDPEPEPEPDPTPPPRPTRNPIAPGGARPDLGGDPPRIRGIQPDIPPEKPQIK